MKKALVVAILLMTSTHTSADSDTIGRFYDSGDSGLDVALFCADNLQDRYFLGKIGDYLSLSACRRIEFRSRIEGINRSIIVEIPRDELRSAAAWQVMSIRFLRPNCEKPGGLQGFDATSAKFQSEGRRGRTTQVPEIGVPIFQMLQKVGRPTDCLVSNAGAIRCYERYSWKVEVDTTPTGAVVEDENARLCDRTPCQIELWFCEKEGEKRIAIRHKDHVNTSITIRRGSTASVHLQLDEPSNALDK